MSRSNRSPAGIGRTVVGPLRAIASLASPRAVRSLAREARSVATHLSLYPLGLFDGCLGRPSEDRDADTFDLPVVLVHGYFHNRSGFFFMARALRKRGFRHVYGMNYNPVGTSIPALAAQLSHHVEDVLRTSGAPKVHIVGHSLGGLIARWYLQEMDGCERVDHCITIGTPHDGTLAAYAGVGRTATEMRPNSDVLERLSDSFERCETRFVNLYSDLDALILPSSSAVLPDRENVHNHLIRDFGHLSLLVSPELIETICEHLADSDVETPLAQVTRLPERSAATADDAKASPGG